jgi:signal transduction histidine kinase
VNVILNRDLNQVKVQVIDDGQGFEVHLPRSGRHVGLWSMRERVEQLGGQLAVCSAPGQGTALTALIPL